MFHETLQKLENMTDHVEFERMMCDLLASHGYKGIDPQSPGLPDGGKDALFFSEEDGGVWFAFSLRKDWKTKFNSDLKQAKDSKHSFNKFVFCTSRALPVLERDKIISKNIDLKIDFWDQERIRVALDTEDKKIRQIYLGIEDNSQTRNKLKNILFDPQNETQTPPRWQILSLIVPREIIGIFELLKDLDLTVICETPNELNNLKDLLKLFRIVRKKASEIDNYIFQIIDQNITNKFVGHWRNISEFCKLLLIGKTREFVINRVKSSHVELGISDCDTIYSILEQDENLKTMLSELTTNHTSLMQTLDEINQLDSLKLN